MITFNQTMGHNLEVKMLLRLPPFSLTQVPKELGHFFVTLIFGMFFINHKTQPLDTGQKRWKHY